MCKIQFEVPGKAVGKQRPRVCLRGGFAHAYTPKKTTAYEEIIRQYFMLASRQKDLASVWQKPIELAITAWYIPPRSV